MSDNLYIHVISDFSAVAKSIAQNLFNHILICNWKHYEIDCS